jgi:hypothetical protein
MPVCEILKPRDWFGEQNLPASFLQVSFLVRVPARLSAFYRVGGSNG